jgi:hypothetical protein
MDELISFTRLTRKKEAPDCPIAKKREKTLKKRKVSMTLTGFNSLDLPKHETLLGRYNPQKM